MAGSFGTKLSLTQTAVNVAGGLVAQFIAAGQYKPESNEDLLNTVFELADGIAAKLDAVRQEELAEGAAPQYTNGGAGGGYNKPAYQANGVGNPGAGKANPETFVLGEQYKAYAGKTLAEVFADQTPNKFGQPSGPAYLKWLAFTSKAKVAKAVAAEFLTARGIAA